MQIFEAELPRPRGVFDAGAGRPAPLRLADRTKRTSTRRDSAEARDVEDVVGGRVDPGRGDTACPVKQPVVAQQEPGARARRREPLDLVTGGRRERNGQDRPGDAISPARAARSFSPMLPAMSSTRATWLQQRALAISRSY